MKKLKYSVGIDISKNDFKACFVTIDEGQNIVIKSSGTFPNSQKGFSDFIKWSNKNRKEDIPMFFLIEATGVYHEQLSWYLFNHEMNVSIVLANRAKKYIQSIGIKSKNDKIDARGLAQMGAEKSLPLWQPISKNIYELRGLTRLHEDLQNQRTMLKNQLHGLQFTMYKMKEVEKSLKKVLKTIEREISSLEEKIKALVDGDTHLKAKYEKITKIKGVGLMSLSTVVAETNGFELFENIPQLVSYAGYDVVENQSGNRAGKTRISKKGNAHIRRILHMPAFTAVKYEPAFKDFYERIYKKNNVKMKAYVAVQKRLLCLIYTLWKKDAEYDPNYQKKHSEAGTEDPLLVGSGGTIEEKEKPSPRALASLDEHSSAFTVSPLLV